LLDSLLQEILLNMSGVKEWDLETITKSCCNCRCYGWEPPEDSSTIQRCGRCKVTNYCSKQCQEEHWHNLHKQHCKYLTKQKVLSKAFHDEATCLVCKEVTMTGMVKMIRPGNPVLGCPMALVNQGVNMNIFLSSTNLPFRLPEMTGRFKTKVEATLTFMMRILLKMKLTNHPVWSICYKKLGDLYKWLESTRISCWGQYCKIIPGPKLDHALVFHLQGHLKLILELMSSIAKLVNAAGFKDQGELKPWDTLKVLSSFLFMLRMEIWRNVAEHSGVILDMSEDLLRRRVTSVQFNEVWQQILDKMHGGLVPYLTLVTVVCGGKLRQTCSMCLEEVQVSDVIGWDGDNYTEELRSIQCPLLHFGIITAAVCSKVLCVESVDGILSNQETKGLILTYGKLYLELNGDRCDFCALNYSGVRGHRCSKCKTKVYCGEQCRDLDWGVHKLVCREGEEVRKRKAGKQRRKQMGSDSFNGLMTFMEQKTKNGGKVTAERK